MVSFIILAGKCIVCADPHETVYFDAKNLKKKPFFAKM